MSDAGFFFLNEGIILVKMETSASDKTIQSLVADCLHLSVSVGIL